MGWFLGFSRIPRQTESSKQTVNLNTDDLKTVDLNMVDFSAGGRTITVIIKTTHSRIFLVPNLISFGTSYFVQMSSHSINKKHGGIVRSKNVRKKYFSATTSQTETVVQYRP